MRFHKNPTQGVSWNYGILCKGPSNCPRLWNETLKNVKQEEVLGVTTDKKLNFTTYLLNNTKYVNIKFKIAEPKIFFLNA